MSKDRSRGLEGLVERGVVPGRTTLGELGALLDPSWLDEADVTLVEMLSGKVPVSWSHEATVAAVTLCGGQAALYLALDEPLSETQIAAGLRRTPGAARASSTVVREAAVSRGGDGHATSVAR